MHWEFQNFQYFYFFNKIYFSYIFKFCKEDQRQGWFIVGRATDRVGAVVRAGEETQAFELGARPVPWIDSN